MARPGQSGLAPRNLKDETLFNGGMGKLITRVDDDGKARRMFPERRPRTTGIIHGAVTLR